MPDETRNSIESSRTEVIDGGRRCFSLLSYLSSIQWEIVLSTENIIFICHRC